MNNFKLKTVNILFRLNQIKNSIKLALNENYVEMDDRLVLKSNDEIAIIPPISGG